MRAKRVRKGKRGLYYTYGKLDDNYHNDLYAPYWERLLQSCRFLIQDLPELFEYLWHGLQGLFWLILLPIVPFIRVYNARKYAKEHFGNKYEEEPEFPKDYYEVITWEDDEDE